MAFSWNLKFTPHSRPQSQFSTLGPTETWKNQWWLLRHVFLDDAMLVLIFLFTLLYALGQDGHIFTQVQGRRQDIIRVIWPWESVLLPHLLNNATVCGMIRIETYSYINGYHTNLDLLSCFIPIVSSYLVCTEPFRQLCQQTYIPLCFVKICIKGRFCIQYSEFYSRMCKENWHWKQVQ